MRFFKINRVRQLLVPHYGKPLVDKCKLLLKLGWKENPVMTTCVLTLPVVFVYTLYFMAFESREDLIRKYNTHITIYRPDDPRVKTIRYDSAIDN